MARSREVDGSAEIDELEYSWISDKKRPKPHACQADCVEVARESGLHSKAGTFGKSNRFGSRVVGQGQHSPSKHTYYSRNAIYKLPHEMGLSCTMGIGSRPKPELPGGMPPSVGPGSYNIVASCAMTKSPLDGQEYCSTTMHHALDSNTMSVSMCSPGPHHPYEVRKPLDHHRPKYNRELLSHGTRHTHPEDSEGPGLKNNDSYHLSVAATASCPDLRGGMPDARGTKRCLKTTFGTSDRFKPAGKQSGSPGGEMGYAHFKSPTSEDYLSRSRSCTFGRGNKTDFSNPYKAHRSSVSPDTYSPIASTTKKTSALDGFAYRCTSPVKSAVRSRNLTASTSRFRSVGESSSGDNFSTIRFGRGSKAGDAAGEANNFGATA